MGEDLERLKQRFPLLEYLQRHHWIGRPVGTGSEFVGLCPLHEETHPSFYVNPHKNLFYCHGCGRGGDLIRFLELSLTCNCKSPRLAANSIDSPNAFSISAMRLITSPQNKRTLADQSTQCNIALIATFSIRQRHPRKWKTSTRKFAFFQRI